MKSLKKLNNDIKDGDYVINTEEGKKAKPRKVITNKYGHLGIELKGHFDWLPIGKRHKKIKIMKTKLNCSLLDECGYYIDNIDLKNPTFIRNQIKKSIVEYTGANIEFISNKLGEYVLSYKKNKRLFDNQTSLEIAFTTRLRIEKNQIKNVIFKIIMINLIDDIKL